jgi:osmotically-inducible protein OsmY
MDGKVTLSGKVVSYTELEEAGLIASEVQGVREVENNITFEWPSKRSDQEIKDDIVATLKRDVYLVGLPITVTVKDGVVTLEGTVGSAYEKDITERDARWISNVKSVNNDLKVERLEDLGVREIMPAPSDANLKKAVSDELKQDIRLNPSDDITVNVSYGGVTLDGTVKNHYDKSIAEQDAHNVVGVGWVIDNLFVRTEKREDWAILDDVQFNLNTDPVTEGLDIGVSVRDGVVTLTGTVNTWYERLHAGIIAGKVKGVRKVVNKIEEYRELTQVHPGAMVAKDIKERLKRNWTVHNVCDQINVTVKNGVATLTGEVDTWAQYIQADEVAFSTEGVWKVDNRLHVKGYDYKWEEWYPEEPESIWRPWSPWYHQ